MLQKTTATGSLYQGLNEEQLNVVRSPDGPMLVIAGAGSGKTRTLTYRVAHLIHSGISPHRILLLTFTNKAAKEMLSRVETLVPADIYKIWGGTFHHIANRILRIHVNHTEFKPGYSILDTSDTKSLLQECLKDAGYVKSDRTLPEPYVLLSILSLSRNTCTSLEETIISRFPYYENLTGNIHAVLKQYDDRKKRINAMDFDDLLYQWLLLMQNNKDIHEYYSDRFSYVLVDEYQDTNRLQSQLIDLIAAKNKNLMVVGDDSQSIYSFRGADFNNIIDFPERYPDAGIFKLENNYRSSPEILHFSNHIIRGNRKRFEKNLLPVRSSLSAPEFVAIPDLFAQASFVADRIERLAADMQLSFNDIAILYRAHFHSMELQMELNQRGIPFEVRSGIRFFEQAHVKDIIAYLRLITNPFDETAWKRMLVSMPGIGDKFASKIFTAVTLSDTPLDAILQKESESLFPKASKSFYKTLKDVFQTLAERPDISPSQAIQAVYEGIYKDIMLLTYPDARGRLDDIERLIDYAVDFDTVSDFLSELALLTSSEEKSMEPHLRNGLVKLSTIHQAKGLEWAVVFIICLVDGRFPNPKNYSNEDDEEEERRLFYVASTRAKDRLYLTAPLFIRDRSGYSNQQTLSRFVTELPELCYEKIDCYSGGYGF